MRIEIKDCEEYSDEFFQFLIGRIQLSLGFHLDRDRNRLSTIDKYINSQPEFKTIFRNYISAKDILLAVVYTLNIRRNQNNVYIEPNRDAIVTGTNAKLIDVCNLITYGNLSINGYPILDKLFDDVQNNIEYLYGEYINKGI